MAKTGSAEEERSGPAPLLIAALALLIIAVVIGAIMIIQRAPSVDDAAAAAGQPGGEGGPPAMPPAAVFVQAVKLEPAQNLAKVTGALRAVSRSELAAQEPGAIAEILTDEGKVVEKDAVVVRLDGRRLKAELASARAALKTAGSLIAQRTAELERATKDQVMKKQLFVEDRAIAESDFLDAENVLAVATAQLDAAKDAVVEAQSRIDLLEVRQKDLDIKAPFVGLITERHVEPGEWVAAGEKVMTIISGSPVEAWLRVPERFLLDLQGQPDRVRVAIENLGELTPSSVRIVPDVDPRSRTFTAVAELDNSDGTLAAGMSITGQVPVGVHQPHLIIPVDALLRTERGDFVFRAGSSGVAERIPVEQAFERDGQIFLLPARNPQLAEGDQVVVEGNDRLQPNQPLMIEERPEAPAPPAEIPEPPKE